MSRRDLTKSQLSELVDDYARLKEEENAISKQTKSMGTKIKDTLIKSDTFEFSASDYTASISTIENDSFDDDKAIEKAKELCLSGSLSKGTYAKLVETKQVFNEDMLKNLIYTGEIADASMFADCVIHKEPTYRLNIKKNK